MPAKQTQKKREATWQEKLKQREPLNRMDEIKADADFNHKFRVREQEERARFEQLKAGGFAAEDDSSEDEAGDDGDNRGQGSN